MKQTLATVAEKNWIKKTFTNAEIEICYLIFGGIPLDELFIRNSNLFKQHNEP